MAFKNGGTVENLPAVVANLSICMRLHMGLVRRLLIVKHFTTTYNMNINREIKKGNNYLLTLLWRFRWVE